MASTWVYFQSDGSRNIPPADAIPPAAANAAENTHHQAMVKAAPAIVGGNALFVYGGDVYPDGTSPTAAGDGDFDNFDRIYSDCRPFLAAIPGNHDWRTTGSIGGEDIPQGFEDYWGTYPPPHKSLTPIDNTLLGASRHHYTQQLGNGWLGVFIDCGEYSGEDCKALKPDAMNSFDTWISGRRFRNVIVFLHHARLSCGKHPDNRIVHPLWKACFAADGSPRVAAWVGGHNHNIGIYWPRAKEGSTPDDAPPRSSSIDNGIYIFNNGAGGEQLYDQEHSDPTKCTFPDYFHDDTHYGFLRIELVDVNKAIFQNFSTGGLGTDPALEIGPPVTILL